MLILLHLFAAESSSLIINRCSTFYNEFWGAEEEEEEGDTSSQETRRDNRKEEGLTGGAEEEFQRCGAAGGCSCAFGHRGSALQRRYCQLSHHVLPSGTSSWQQVR